MKIGKFNLHEFRGWKAVCAAFLFCAVATIASSAQTFNVLTNFDGTNGGNPYGSLVQGEDGNFYGTTNVKGPTDYGTAFKITSAGQLTTLYSFCSQPQCADGGEPRAGLIQGTDGLFYGTTTMGGGQTGDGTLFGMTSTGTLSGAYDFGADNFPSNAALVQSPGGDLYGLTAEQVFKITRSGKLTTLYTFTNGTSAGNGLMQASNGNFYITTYYGGAYGFGAIYKMTPSGNVTTLYSFCPSNCDDDNGFAPDATMVEGNDGSLYGTTSQGGTNGDGTVFKIALGKITTLYNFCSQTGCTDGSYPLGLVQGSDGNFYGVTYYGGNNGGYLSGEGTLYKITPAGQLTTLYRFCSQTNCADGSGPLAALMQGTDGNFYGTTLYGGSNASACPPFIFSGPCGTVFSLSTGLGPFVKLTQNFGSVGHTGGILGQGFTGTTGVFLNGTPASFTVISDTFIQATVPAGATSGFVTVNTPSGTLTSNVPFHVKP
jgi:uncharacterized repeat protein (TIGR03803 family)